MTESALGAVPDTIGAWRAANARRAAVTAGGLVLLLGSFAADLATGPAMLPVGAVVRSLLRLGADPMLDAIVRTLRLPIALMAAVVGAALGVSGAVMQTILNNPLASSYTLGISAGAGFGAALAILAGAVLPLPEAWAVPGAAFLFAGLACALVAGVGRLRGATPELLVLAGIACLFLFQALLALLQFLASPEALQQIVFWLFGSLLRSSMGKVGIVALVLAATVPVLLADSWRLTALKLGDDRALGAGRAGGRAAAAGIRRRLRAHRRRGRLRRHDRLHRPSRAAHRPHAGRRGPAPSAAGLRRVRRPAAVGRLGGQQADHARHRVPHRHRHCLDRRAVLRLARAGVAARRLIVQAHFVTVRYGSRVAVDGVSLSAQPGEVLAILGANGSGKSSLLRALAGVQRCGGTVAHNRAADAVGYMPQDNAVRAALTAFEVVLLGRLRSLALRVGERDPRRGARRAGRARHRGPGASRRIGELSGGQRQLVFIAQVLAADPRILLLDEPTSALDIAHQLHVLGLLRAATARRGLTTIAVLHDLNAGARFADRIVLMRAGQLVASGLPGEVLAAPILRTAYDVEVSVLTGPDGFPVVIPLRAAS